MSSYLTFYLAKKEDFNTFNEKLNVIKSKEDYCRFSISKEEQEAWDNFTKHTLCWVTRSSPLYRYWSQEAGYNEDLVEVSKDIVNSVISTLSRDLEDLKKKISLYEETNLFDGVDNEEAVADSIMFIKNKMDASPKNSDEANSYRKVLDFLKKISFDDLDNQSWKEEYYEELKEEKGDFEFALSTLQIVEKVLDFNEFDKSTKIYWNIG